MMNNHDFCKSLLSQVRQEANSRSVVIPKRITALKSSTGHYFVEANGMKGEYIEADCAFEARAKLISNLIDKDDEN